MQRAFGHYDYFIFNFIFRSQIRDCDKFLINSVGATRNTFTFNNACVFFSCYPAPRAGTGGRRSSVNFSRFNFLLNCNWNAICRFLIYVRRYRAALQGQAHCAWICTSICSLIVEAPAPIDAVAAGNSLKWNFLRRCCHLGPNETQSPIRMQESVYRKNMFLLEVPKMSPTRRRFVFENGALAHDGTTHDFPVGENVRRTNFKFTFQTFTAIVRTWECANAVPVQPESWTRRIWDIGGMCGESCSLFLCFFYLIFVVVVCTLNSKARSMAAFHSFRMSYFLFSTLSPLQSLDELKHLCVSVWIWLGFKIKTTLRHLRSDSVIHRTCINCFNEQKTLLFAKDRTLWLTLETCSSSSHERGRESGVRHTTQVGTECVKNGETETSAAQINN